MDAKIEACKGKTTLEELVAYSNGVLKVKKGAYLFEEGTACMDFYVVKSGKIQSCKTSEDGREIAISLTSEWGIVGEIVMKTRSSVHIFSAKALVDSEVYVISSMELEQAIAKDGKLALKIMNMMSLTLQKQQTKFRDLFLNGKKGALYSTLIRLSNTYGKITEQGILIDIPFTNQELANYSFTTREGVNRMLQELLSQGIVSIGKGKKILIHDLPFLKKQIQCENCPIEYCNLE